MDPYTNPFSPGAGSRPPQLAGRLGILEDAKIALGRVAQGKSAQSQILLGLRGTGKTVLLNEIERYAEEKNYLTSFIEAPEDKTLTEMLYPQMRQALRKMSVVESARSLANKALSGLRNFASVFKVKIGEVDIGVEPTPGVADSGNLEFDLTEMFVLIGEAAKASGRGWALLIDEVQYLKKEELAAIIVAVHRVGQKGLPLVVVAAGLPQIAKLSGDAKSYAERLFSYPAVGALNKEAAEDALVNPIQNEGAEIDPEALEEIIARTSGYPFFIQEWGHHSWNVAEGRRISFQDVEIATSRALARLDEGFFRVRMDRLTNAEIDYVHAMAALGRGPYKSTDVAKQLEKAPSALGPCRASIIKKGMIYSPNYGEVEFTVPLFDDFLRRNR
ncbi:ATP-binding protein [Maricaulis alexandrii]|uniref:ATP-binding protein n=1 Tax=Maricaulis alexandrii TaxID=2570354 RepID=UPI00110970BC|nr:ATP-binding protein [Maricaulis alexandrii]